MSTQKCAGIAQLVEQRTENPRVTSSSLVPGIPRVQVWFLAFQEIEQKAPVMNPLYYGKLWSFLEKSGDKCWNVILTQ